jgi:hypothetical protein
VKYPEMVKLKQYAENEQIVAAVPMTTEGRKTYQLEMCLDLLERVLLWRGLDGDGITDLLRIEIKIMLETDK